MSKEKVAVYVGRFNAPHNAHAWTYDYALEKYDHLIILVGSAGLARDPRNPFTFEERKSMIEGIVAPTLAKLRAGGKRKKVSILPVHDYVYDHTKWLTEVQLQVSSATTSHDITLVGYEKDSTSYYLKFFPQWGKKGAMDVAPFHEGYNATDVRNAYFTDGTIMRDKLPAATIEFLEKFRFHQNGELYAYLKEEHDFYENYKKAASVYPYPPIYVTGDAVVTCAGHILLITRKHSPGKGLMALPGGFINQEETVEQCILRELTEETELKVPDGVIARAIRGNITVFDSPTRSLRGRTITHCGHVVLNDTTLPKVRGMDDAAKAEWVPISKVVTLRDQFFEDHYSIISCVLKL